jgi:uncharacterized membrane protein YgcG
VARGDAFSRDQRLRLDRGVAAASGQTGIRFTVYVGALEGSAGAQAERLLTQVARPDEAAALILVAPAERVLQIATTRGVAERLPDHACALAILSMTTSFGVGDLVGGIVSGLRMLADAAGRSLLQPPPLPEGPLVEHSGG